MWRLLVLLLLLVRLLILLLMLVVLFMLLLLLLLLLRGPLVELSVGRSRRVDGRHIVILQRRHRRDCR
jgi:hypothetical protein